MNDFTYPIFLIFIFNGQDPLYIHNPSNMNIPLHSQTNDLQLYCTLYMLHVKTRL